MYELYRRMQYLYIERVLYRVQRIELFCPNIPSINQGEGITKQMKTNSYNLNGKINVSRAAMCTYLTQPAPRIYVFQFVSSKINRDRTPILLFLFLRNRNIGSLIIMTKLYK